MLSNVPGGVTFESAPFKLTPEFLELLDLPLYRELCKKAFIALRRKADDLVMLVELMGRGSRMPCFGSGVGYVVRELRGRFVGGLSESEAEAWVDELIRKSAGSYFTKMVSGGSPFLIVSGCANVASYSMININICRRGFINRLCPLVFGEEEWFGS